MKKASIVLLLVLITLTFNGCQLAITDNADSTNNSDDILETDLGYIPIEFKYEIYDSKTSSLVDVSEYIYYSWLVSDNLSDEYLVTGCDFGASMEAVVCSTHVNIVENDEGIESKETEEIFEANVYIHRDLEGTPLYPIVTLMNYSGEEKIEEQYGVAMHEGLSSTNEFETVFPDGEVFKLSIKLNYIILDDLQTIEIKEYNEEDNLINTTLITEETILDELVLQDETDYIFIVESYLDQAGETYTERLYFYDEETVYYKYKYFNEEGFLYLDILNVVFPE